MKDKKEWPWFEDGVREKGTASIQLKGTDLCMDWNCPNCNELNHDDGMFMFQVKCEKCNNVYQVGNRINLRELDTKRFKQWQEGCI